MSIRLLPRWSLAWKPLAPLDVAWVNAGRGLGASRPSIENVRCLRRSASTQVQTRISPVLLAKARAIAEEHDVLTRQLADGFDAAAAKRISQLSRVTSRLKDYNEQRDNLKELDAMYGEDKEVNAMVDEEKEDSIRKIQDADKALLMSLIPVHPFADLPCLLEFRPGAGGEEASIFAGDLLRMYQAFCDRHGYSTTLLKCEGEAGTGGAVQVQEAILEVNSPGAYGILRCEAGVHRVQRVPATESKGRTHTSAASVLVLPSLPDEGGDELEDFNDPNSDYYIDTKDVRSEVMRASGAGGQHVNKTESAVRLTHIPTGTVVFMQEFRSQPKNKEKAWQLLRSRIAQQRREVREAEVAQARRSAGAGKVGREHKVRTYNWSQQRVTDHRSGFESRRLDDVMAGQESLDAVMESVRAWMSEQDVLSLEEDTGAL